MAQLRRVEHRDVPLDSIRPNTWNYRGMDSRMMEKERASFKRFGYVLPILVRAHPDGEGFEILDGEHRWKTAGSLELGQIDVIELVDDETGEALDDVRAREITIVINETHGEPRYEDLSKLVGELNAQVGITRVAEVMPFPSAELQAMIGIFKLPKPLRPGEGADDDDDGDEGDGGEGVEHSDDKDGKEDGWESISLRVPPGTAARFDEAVKIATEGKNVPRDVRVGLALEAISEAFLAQHKIRKSVAPPAPKKRSSKKSEPTPDA